MSVRYILTLRARFDLAAIVEHVSSQSGDRPAESVVLELRKCFQFLAENPGVGHERSDLTEDPAVRFWTSFPYLVAFVAEEQPLAIVGIVHGAREPQDLRQYLRGVREEESGS